MECWFNGKRMDDSRIILYITNVFYPWLVARKIQLPVVLYVDGHSSHLTMPLSAFCRKNGIELVALYPNATHILQPLDVSVFHPLKQSWKKAVDKWRLDNAPQRVRKDNFAPLLKQAVDSINLVEIVRNGFKTCGLWPFSADAVNYNILNKNKKQEEVPEQQSEHSINKINSYEEDCKKHLEFFEKHISNDMLHKFKNAELHGSPTLLIDIKNEGLYEYWKMMKGLSEMEANVQETNLILNIENMENDNHDINIPIKIVENSGTFYNENIDFEIIDLININNEDLNRNFDTIDTLLEGSSENIDPLQSSNSSLLNLKDVHHDTQNQINNSNVIKINETNNNLQNSNSELNKENIHLREMVSSPFKRALLWPEKISKNMKMKKKTEKIPTVATSDEWQAYHFKKEEEKAKKELEKVKRQEKRKAAQQKKAEEQSAKKIIIEEKKKKQAEKKRLLEKKKLKKVRKEK